MSFITHLNIRDGEVTPSKLDTGKNYTVSGLSATYINIGSQVSQSTAQGNRLYIKETSQSASATIESTLADGHAGIVLKNDNVTWISKASGTASDSYIIQQADPGIARLTISCSGTFGFNTAQPDIGYRAHFDNAGEMNALFKNSTDNISVGIEANGSSGSIGSVSNSSFGIKTNDVTVTTIDTSGNLTQTGYLKSSGNVASASTTPTLIICNTSTTHTAGNLGSIAWETDDTSVTTCSRLAEIVIETNTPTTDTDAIACFVFNGRCSGATANAQYAILNGSGIYTCRAICALQCITSATCIVTPCIVVSTSLTTPTLTATGNICAGQCLCAVGQVYSGSSSYVGSCLLATTGKVGEQVVKGCGSTGTEACVFQITTCICENTAGFMCSTVTFTRMCRQVCEEVFYLLPTDTRAAVVPFCATICMVTPIVYATSCLTTPHVCITGGVIAGTCITIDSGIYATSLQSAQIHMCSACSVAGALANCIYFKHCDNAGAIETYAGIESCVVNSTAGGECGALVFKVHRAANLCEILHLATGYATLSGTLETSSNICVGYTSTSTNGVFCDLLTIAHNTSATPADGIGSGLRFSTQQAVGNPDYPTSAIKGILNCVAGGYGNLTFSVINGGNMCDVMCISTQGGLCVCQCITSPIICSGGVIGASGNICSGQCLCATGSVVTCNGCFSGNLDVCQISSTGTISTLNGTLSLGTASTNATFFHYGCQAGIGGKCRYIYHSTGNSWYQCTQGALCWTVDTIVLTASGGVCMTANLCVGGTLGKAAGSFVINHPCCNKEEPNQYNSMNLVHGFEEGPKYGIFYEGEDHLCDGIALVKLPEYFDKLVNRNDGIYIQLTNVGGWTPLVVKVNDNCKVCGNCFWVCTTSDGVKDSSFDWRLSASRGDDYVVTDNTQTDDLGMLCVEMWKQTSQTNRESLDVLNKSQLQGLLTQNDLVFTTSQTKADLVNLVVAN